MRLVCQLVEKRFGVFEVWGVEALGEPVVDFGKHRTRLVATAGIAQQAGKTHCGAKLPPLRRLASRDFNGLAKARLRLGSRRGTPG